MAIQQWTILKLVGPAAEDAASRVDRWWHARRSDDPTCFTPGDWAPATRRAAAAYVARLEAHRWATPVVYFSQHVDQWLASNALGYHLLGSTMRIWHDGGELWCHRLPDRGRLVRRNQASAASAQLPETQWLAGRLVEAARAYEGLWRDATVLVNRRAVTASPTDEEHLAAARALPAWLGRGRACASTTGVRTTRGPRGASS